MHYDPPVDRTPATSRRSVCLDATTRASTKGARVTLGRVLVTGAGGQLGSAILRAFAGADVLALQRSDLDITDAAAVRSLVGDVRPALIVNCAAFNDVDGAEAAPARALAVNAFAVRSLARGAEACGATLVHYGSDFVFDGEAARPYTEEAPPAPRSTYAASKLLGEWLALDAPRAFVLRVESLFGCAAAWQGRRGSLDAIVDGLEHGRDVRVFTDRVVSPSYIDDVAAATRHLVTSGAAPGLYHCVNSGAATWHDVAAEAARLLGVPPRFTTTTMADAKLRAARPRYCALDNAKLAAAGFRMPPWQDALRRWLAIRRQPAA
jgi:dTDP-4-dehydrorhamnose reductase